jgi:hypothetical protein
VPVDAVIGHVGDAVLEPGVGTRTASKHTLS